jgi:hypothetical protein
MSSIEYLKGTLGALLGAIVGGIVMLFANLVLGFTILSGVAVSFCAGRGFLLVSKQIDRHVPWICWAFSLPVFLAAVLVSCALPQVIGGIQASGIHGALQALSGIFKNAFTGNTPVGFPRDMAFSFLFLALGGLDIVNALTDSGAKFWTELF